MNSLETIKERDFLMFDLLMEKAGHCFQSLKFGNYYLRNIPGIINTQNMNRISTLHSHKVIDKIGMVYSFTIRSDHGYLPDRVFK
jgi:hypothetical protein